jgi:DNA-binding transcriptional regulator of glucitol operon
MKKLILITGILFLLTSAIATAQTTNRSITSTQINQQKRIKQGVKDKTLTKKEARKLEAQQKKIRIEKKMAKADGKITPNEKKILKHEQKQASKNIYREKHNKQNRV